VFFKFIRKHLLALAIILFFVFVISVILLPLYRQKLIMVGRQAIALLPPAWTIEKVQLDDFPSIGKWMLDNQGQPADWLGIPLNGKQLQEPINVIIIDRVASSSNEAKEKLHQAFEVAGYPARTGHSSGYQGFIGNNYYPMLPGKINHAYSDESFDRDNNHGRVFGPYFDDESYFFIAAFSREEVAPLKKNKHPYSSFVAARDDVAHRLNDYTSYDMEKYVHLNNAFVNNIFITTGDHDGLAAVVVVRD